MCAVAHDVHVGGPIEFLVEEEAKVPDCGFGGYPVICVPTKVWGVKSIGGLGSFAGPWGAETDEFGLLWLDGQVVLP